ncbi:hypothetical protein J4225_03190 [Candidatus Pacearchaeota archaeon]|nr:hypothetical protein [Candidatus Pacearchaeota archaeon]
MKKKSRKKTSRHEIAIILIGILFIIIGMLAVIQSIKNGNPSQILWFCYAAVILIGIGFLMRNYYLIITQLNILLIPLIVWNIDFFYVLITSKTLFGITNYFFVEGLIIEKVITMQHVFTIPLTLYALYILKIKRADSWKTSFLELACIFLMVRLLTSAEDNINCAYFSCVNFIPTLMFHPIVWFFAVFLMVFISGFLINQLKFLRHK